MQYEGDVRRDEGGSGQLMAHGHGTWTLPSERGAGEQRLEGQFVDGRPHGQGRIFQQKMDGRWEVRFQGQFEHGFVCGPGALQISDREIIRSDFFYSGLVGFGQDRSIYAVYGSIASLDGSRYYLGGLAAAHNCPHGDGIIEWYATSQEKAGEAVAIPRKRVARFEGKFSAGPFVLDFFARHGLGVLTWWSVCDEASVKETRTRAA